MSEKVGDFFRNFGGFIIGAIVGLIFVWCKIIDIIVSIAVVLGCGFLGAYVHRNKSKVKEVLKNLIERW